MPTKTSKEPGFGNAKVFLKAPTQPIYRIVLVVESKDELCPFHPPPCLDEFDAVYREDFPKMVFHDQEQSYIESSNTMHDKRYGQTFQTLIS